MQKPRSMVNIWSTFKKQTFYIITLTFFYSIWPEKGEAAGAEEVGEVPEEEEVEGGGGDSDLDGSDRSQNRVEGAEDGGVEW